MTEQERIASLVAVRKAMLPPPVRLYVSPWTFAQLASTTIDGLEVVPRDDFSAYRTDSEPPPDRHDATGWDHKLTEQERNS